MRSYEMVFIAHPELEGDEMTALVGDIETLIERQEGTVKEIEPWGRRRLAYPIQDQREGQYVMFHVDMPPQGVSAVERGLHLMESVLRHLIVREE